ncbi:MAG TPA: cytochrome c, partial [Sphingomonadaceae bacterium]|nr:cytochrome c [Sphingomonadaceae bacterium]
AAAPHVVKADLPGRAIFEHNCAPCHGAGPGDDGAPMLPGTMALQRRYEGEVPAALELRDDLDGDALRLFVRNGIGAMPMFRKSELSDADVDAVAAYLKATAEASAVK